MENASILESNGESNSSENTQLEGGKKSKTSLERLFDKILVKKDLKRFNRSLG